MVTARRRRIGAAGALLLAVACRSAAPPAGTAALAAAPSRFARLDGMRIHYKSLGSGSPTLVFVHGWSGDLNVWRMQAKALARSSRLVFVDLPGHGRSDKPAIAYTMDLFARAVNAVLLDADVSRAVLIGHSMGTPVVRQFFRLFPEKTAALVAVDGALRPFTLDRTAVAKFIAPYRAADYQEAAGRFIAAMFPNPGTEKLRDEVVATVRGTPQHVMVGAFEGMFDPAIWKEDPITVPLLVVLAKSPFWTPDYEAFVSGLAADVDYRVVEGPGHFLMMERPQALDEALAEFLAARGLLRS